MKKKTIYIFGNSLVAEDRKAPSLLSYLQAKLPQCQFVHLDPTEEFDPKEDNELILIDTVVGIKQVTLFENIDQFAAPPRFSAHDFDLFVELRFLKKVGKMNKLTIIGIPADGDQSVIRRAVFKILSSKKL